MRILHVVHQYPPEHMGGTEFYTQWLAGYLSQAGHSVSVVYPTTRSEEPVSISDLDDGTRIYRLGSGPRSRTRIFLDTFGNHLLGQAFGTTLADARPDIVHVQHLMGLPTSLIRTVQEKAIPYVITLHDYWYGCANAQLITNYDQTICSGPDRLFYNCGRCALARAGLPLTQLAGLAPAPLLAYRHRLLASVLNNASCIITPSQFVADMYQRMGVAHRHIKVVAHGIALPDRSPSPSVADKSTKQLRIGYLGNLAWQKGVHHLIEAVNHLPDEARLTIYGSLESFPEYVAQLRRLARHPGIHFRGAVARQDVWSALAQLDVLVVPSLWHETASLVVQEAFACGVPVIASRVGALPEKIRHGIDGILVPPGDAAVLREQLLQLINDPDRLAQMRQNIGPVRTIKAHGQDIEAIYQRALGQPR